MHFKCKSFFHPAIFFQTTHKASKLSALACMLLVQLAWMNVLNPCSTWKTFFLIEFIITLEVFLNHHVAVFCETSILKESVF